MEHIGLHPKSPYFFQFRTQMLLGAEVEWLVKKATLKLNQTLESQQQQLSDAKKELKVIENKINSLEEKYIFNSIEKDVYYSWKPKLVEEKQLTIETIESFSTPIKNIVEKFNSDLFQLTNLSYLFNESSTLQKQAFVNVVFDNNLYYQDNIYRTPDILPLFYSKSLILKQKNLLIIEKVFNKSDAFVGKCPEQELHRTIKPLLNWINSLKVA